jgi:glycosyltransferase involved in cell wall biosynthesis
MLKLVERTVVKDCEALIAVNKLTARYFRMLGAHRTVTIYTGVEGDFQPCEAEIPTLKARYNLEDRRVVLYAGTLNIGEVGAPSGYDLMMPLTALPKILEEIPDATLVFVGDGNGKQSLMRLSRAINVQRDVIFTGFMSRKEVFTWIGAADVVLVPYADAPNNRLTTPTKLWEYMAIGRPIVATRFPGIGEVIRDGHNGLLYPVGSVDELARCVVRILGSRQLAMRLASTAKQDFIERYSFQPNWSKLIGLYDQILRE